MKTSPQKPKSTPLQEAIGITTIAAGILCYVGWQNKVIAALPDLAAGYLCGSYQAGLFACLLVGLSIPCTIIFVTSYKILLWLEVDSAMKQKRLAKELEDRIKAKEGKTAASPGGAAGGAGNVKSLYTPPPEPSLASDIWTIAKHWILLGPLAVAVAWIIKIFLFPFLFPPQL